MRYKLAEGEMGLASTQGGGMSKGKVEGVWGCEEELLADPTGEGAPARSRTHSHEFESGLDARRRTGLETCN